MVAGPLVAAVVAAAAAGAAAGFSALEKKVVIYLQRAVLPTPSIQE